MKNKKSKGQPRPSKSFTGWAVYNWGMPLNIVFRTRSKAIEYILDEDRVGNATLTWKQASKNMAVAKAQCYVDLVKCECGHTVPVEFAHIDNDGCWTCSPCQVLFLNDIINSQCE